MKNHKDPVHSSHEMKHSRTTPDGLLRLNNECRVCRLHMWGSVLDWNHDVALELPCKGAK